VDKIKHKIFSIILSISFSVSALPAAHGQEVIYLIRHAEQELHVEDPPLTETGHKRAKAWAGILRDADIKVIYTSKKRRTKQTGEHIARALNIPLETMSRRDVVGLVNRLRARHADEVVLVISHTRTIPKLFKELGHSEDVTIQRDDYDNLFVIVPKNNNQLIVLRLRY
jgi:broad specificity phosphatase PhoE